MKYKIIFLSFLFSPIALASKAKLFNVKGCDPLYVRSAANMITDVDVFGTLWPTLEKGLIKSGLDKKEIKEFMRLVSFINPKTKLPSNAPEPYKRLKADLASSDLEKKTIFCFPAAGCKFTLNEQRSVNGAVIHFMEYSRFRADSDSEVKSKPTVADDARKSEIIADINDKESTKGLASFFESQVAKKYPYMLFFDLRSNQTGKLDYVRAASTFLHEVRHVANKRLIPKWLKSNLDLKKAGEQTDRLFRKYVKVTREDISVEEGFEQVLEEGVAYHITHLVEQLSGKYPTDKLASAAFVKDKFDTLYAYGSFVKYALQEEGIHQGNFFEKSEAMLEEMRATIQRARDL